MKIATNYEARCFYWGVKNEKTNLYLIVIRYLLLPFIISIFYSIGFLSASNCIGCSCLLSFYRHPVYPLVHE